jgi:hypothetical protein
MDEEKPCIELPVDTSSFLRVYVYSYQNNSTRLTISLETEDTVIASTHITPPFCPITGKKNAHEFRDIQELIHGISFQRSRGKKLDNCCYLTGHILHLKVEGRESSFSFPYDLGTGKPTS